MPGKIIKGIKKGITYATIAVASLLAGKNARAEIPATIPEDPETTTSAPAVVTTPAVTAPTPTTPAAPSTPPVIPPAPATPTTGYSPLDFRVAEFGLTAYQAKDKDKSTKLPDAQYRLALEGELLVPLTLTFSGAYKDLDGAVNQHEIKGTLDLNRLANLFGFDAGTFKLQGLLSQRKYDAEFSPLAQTVRANYAGGILSIPFGNNTSLYLEGGSQTKIEGADDAEYAILRFMAPLGDNRFSITALIDTLLASGERHKQVQGRIGYEIPLFDGVSLDLYAGHSTRQGVNPTESGETTKKGVDYGLGIRWQGDLHDIRVGMMHDQFTEEDHFFAQFTFRLNGRKDVPTTSDYITHAQSSVEIDGGETGGPGTG